jgi:hypothetical protein
METNAKTAAPKIIELFLTMNTVNTPLRTVELCNGIVP